MRYFLTLSLICLALIVSAVGVAPTAHAQLCPAGQFPDAFGTCYASESARNAADTKSAGESTAAASSLSSSPGASGTGIPTNPGDSTGGFATVIQWIMSLFAWLVGVAALTLDTAVLYTVVGMGNYVKNLSAIGVAWTVLRDIGNIALIFGFLAVGITVILNVDFYGGGKKLLPTLIIAAVALNFSLFVSEAVIDVGNLFATQIYTQINGGQQAGVKGLDPGYSIRTANEGISNAIMAQLGLQGIYDDARRNHELFKSGNSWVIGFMGILLFLVVAFVMFSLALILIARFVILIFLIILSPVGVAGLAIPKLQNSAKLWWSTLLEQTITAPILLLLLYVALRVILDPLFLKGFGANNNGAWTSFFGGGSVANYGSMLLSFLVAMGLLLAVVLFAKKMSAFGAGWATSMGGKLSFGATALASRTTVGWGAGWAARGLRKTWVARVPFAGTGLVKGLEGTARSSFDVRGTSALKSFPGGGIDAGTAQKGGYEAELKARIEKRTKYAEGLKGRDLTDQEKIDAAKLGVEIKEATKKLQGLRARGAPVADVKVAEEDLEKKETALEKIEKVTDRGAQRKYATVLELGLGQKNWFNLRSNLEAAKSIRKEAKKSPTDKDWSANMKKILKDAAKEDEEGAGTTGTGAGTTPPTAGTPPSATGPAAPTGGGQATPTP